MSLLAGTDLYSAVKPSERKGGEGYLFGGVMSLVMGLMTVVRLTKNMPRKLTEAAIYGGAAEKGETAMVSTQEYMSMVKRMAELEEKCRSLDNQPAPFSAEKEQILNAALTRVDQLEFQLSETKKVTSFLLFVLCNVLNTYDVATNLFLFENIRRWTKPWLSS